MITLRIVQDGKQENEWVETPQTRRAALLSFGMRAAHDNLCGTVQLWRVDHTSGRYTIIAAFNPVDGIEV